MVGRRAHRGKDEHLLVQRDAARPSRRRRRGSASLTPHAGEAMPSAPRRHGRVHVTTRSLPGRRCRGRWMTRSAAPSGARHLERERVRGHAALSVGDDGAHERRGGPRTARRRAGRREPEPAHHRLGQDARHHDQAEQHRREEIEQVVAGVDGREAEADRGEQAPPAVARGPDRAPRPEEPPDPTRRPTPFTGSTQASGQRGTGTSWQRSRRITRLAVASPRAVACPWPSPAPRDGRARRRRAA